MSEAMKPIPPEHKDFITHFIHGKYPNFKPDVWGRLLLEDDDITKDEDKDLRFTIAGYDGTERGAERRYFEATLIKTMFGIEMLWLNESKTIYSRS